MEKTVTQRVIQVLDEKRTSVLAFCEATGLPRSTFNRQVKTDSICLQFVQKILEYYPDISTDWLVMGRGDMYRATKSADVAQPKKLSFIDLLLTGLCDSDKDEIAKVKQVVDNVAALKK